MIAYTNYHNIKYSCNNANSKELEKNLIQQGMKFNSILIIWRKILEIN
jgi:hypothetical protein